MTTEDRGMDRLARAVGALMEWEHDPRGISAEDFLAENEELQDLLRPMLEERTQPSPAHRAPSLATDRQIGDFRLVREIGRGGMGVVYEAVQTKLNRRVALKVLPAHLALEPRALGRFKREALTAARLDHDGIVHVLDVGIDDDVHYFAMEYVEGAPLDRVLARLRAQTVPSRLTGADVRVAVHAELVDRASTAMRTTETGTSHWRSSHVETMLGIALQIADALSHAHAANVLHRDVKPANILVRADGSAVLTDFGLAREIDVPTLTMTGEFAGTPAYVSPEQADGRRDQIGPATDVFSLAATLYELLTFARPFPGESHREILAHIAHNDPVDPSRLNPHLHPDLVAILAMALEKDRRRRYADGGEIAEDLRAFLDYRPVRARRVTAVSRLRRWVRRSPLRAVVVLVLPLLVLVSAGLGGFLLARGPEIRAGREQLLEEQVWDLIEEGSVVSMARGPLAAQPILRRALKLDPDNPYAITSLVQAVTVTDSILALKLLGEHHERGQEPRALDRLRAGLLERVGRTEESAALYAELGPPISDLDFFVAGLVALPLQGERLSVELFAEPVRLFRNAIYRARNANYLHFQWLAFAASRGEDRSAAFECAGALIELWPESEAAVVSAGVAYSFIDNERAIETFDRALAIVPDSTLALRNKALALSASGRRDEAIPVIERCIELFPRSASNHSILAMLLMRQGRNEEAIEVARQAHELDPETARYLGDLAAAQERSGDPVAALQTSLQAVELEPRWARGHRNVIGIAGRLGEIEVGERELERWTALHPDDPMAWHQRAHWKLVFIAEPTAAQRTDVLKSIEEARRLAGSDDARLLITWARTLSWNGRDGEAQEALDRAEQMLPDDPEARAKLLEEIGQAR